VKNKKLILNGQLRTKKVVMVYWSHYSYSWRAWGKQNIQ